MKRRSWFIATWLLPVFVLGGCAGPSLVMERREERAALPETVRVAVLTDLSRLELQAHNAVLFSKGDRIQLPANAVIVVKERSVLINGREFPTPVSIHNSSPILINGKRYHGDLEITASTLINRIPMDVYLRGVLSSEMPEGWPLEALKAQAVVSRTYVYKKILAGRDGPFDIGATELHQKYDFLDVNQKIDDAVSQTEGLILLYRDEPIEAFFHSCSGGRTESSRDIFQRDLPYLRSIPDPYCGGNGRFSWSLALSSSQLLDALKRVQTQDFNAVHGGVAIRDLRIYRRTSSGRVKEFALILENGETYVVAGNALRLAVDPKSFKSLLIDVITRERRGGENYFTLEGRGYGHGVGMSQWGAKEMAERGFSFRQILSHYYPGTTIGRASAVRRS